MSFWNFVHGSLGMHVYELLAILFLIAMLVIAAVHVVKERLASDNKNTAGAETPAAEENGRGE